MAKLILFLLVAVYVGGIWKFLSGYRQTSFNDSLINRIYLAALWPALLLISQSYRQNFNKALKGS
jgi:hypothetical protein